ncbi:MAG: hypothetical protein ACYDAP_03640 [Thermoplasmataceae archaeon]
MPYARITDGKMIRKSTISQRIECFRPDTITDFINSGNMVFVDTPPLSWFRNYRNDLLPHPTKGDSHFEGCWRELHGFEFPSAGRYSVFQHGAMCYPATFIHSFGKCETSLENVNGSVAYRDFISSVKEIGLSAGKRMLLICSGVWRIWVPGISISKKFIIETNSLHWVLKELIRKNHDRIPWEGDCFDF